MIAALFVQGDGIYSKDAIFDVWDEKRDARKYDGEYPVIAHPPLSIMGKSRLCEL